MTHLTIRPTGANELTAAASTARKTAGVRTQSFTDELSQTFSGAHSNIVKPAADHTSSQINVAGQKTIAASKAVTSPVGFNALVPKTSAAVSAPSASASVATDAVQSADDAYWAKQPAAVQQLRNIDDYSQRAELGAQLASEGYSIDTPVMVWGWDPGKTTQLRQDFGYTWVPSAMQSPVTAAPGITGAGIIPYNPANPPAGSINV
jgi:hypothetical protein